MLVLTRKPEQSIVIGSDIEITVLEVRGEQVRLGIRAPRDVPVHRKEVFDQICNDSKNQTVTISSLIGEATGVTADPINTNVTPIAAGAVAEPAPI